MGTIGDIQQLLDIWNSTNDNEARNRLIERSLGRFKQLARMLLRRGDPLRRYYQSDDLINDMFMRLQERLKSQRPATADEYADET